MTLLGTGTDAKGALPPYLFSSQNLLKTAMIAAAGVVLFLLASTKPGKKLMHLIRRRPRGFQGLFLSFTLGLAGLSLWLIIQSRLIG